MKPIYAVLSQIDCSGKTEKIVHRAKTLTYLSWTYALDILYQHYPEATFAVKPDPTYFVDGSAEVQSTVTINGLSRSMWLPVLDSKNAAIQNPNSFQINKAKMRCLTKNISVFGLGLYIYAGEDLPMVDDEDSKQKQTETPVNDKILVETTKPPEKEKTPLGKPPDALSKLAVGKSSLQAELHKINEYWKQWESEVTTEFGYCTTVQMLKELWNERHQTMYEKCLAQHPIIAKRIKQKFDDACGLFAKPDPDAFFETIKTNNEKKQTDTARKKTIQKFENFNDEIPF